MALSVDTMIAEDDIEHVTMLKDTKVWLLERTDNDKEKTMATDLQRKDRLTRFLQEVWTDGDLDAADKYVGDTYTLHHDPGDLWHGRTLDLEAFKNRVRVSRAPFPDQRFTVAGLFEDSDAVVATWHWAGTHTGDLNGFPATGKQITMSGATVYYFDGDDRLTGHWQVTDRLSVFQQLRSPG
jgi:steroid delta-isomerase-like uncharacterized protein